MNDELSLISVMICSKEEQKGSGCLLWSNDKTKLYCITAAHCIENIDHNKILVKNDVNSFENISIEVNNSDYDVAVLQINDDVDVDDVPVIHTYDCDNITYDKILIVGFPYKFDNKQIEVLCQILPHDKYNYTVCVDSLDPNHIERFDDVNGLSGSGCFYKSGNTYKFIGIENKAISLDVPFKNLNCIKYELINSLIEEAGLLPLPTSTPEYITDERLNFELSNDYLSSHFPNEWCVTEIFNMISNKIDQFFYGLDRDCSTLFIGGLSGSGKTRSVLEAVKNRKHFIYYSSYSDFENDILQIKKYKGKVNIIVDEVSIDNYYTINSVFRGKGDTIKIIVIGCAPPNQNCEYDNINMLFLNKLTKEDTIAVLRANYSWFEYEECQAIFDLSSNDLRLAMMIANIYDKDRTKDVATIPAKHLRDKYSSATQILSKMLELSIEGKPQDIDLEKCFNHFSLFVDIGYKNQYESELRELSNYFNVNYSDYRRAIDYFDQIQLGIKKGDYFEESPRALAKYAFEQNAFPLVKYDLDAFMSSMTSETLRKRFIERVAECDIRGVTEELSSWFLRNYSIHNINEKLFSKRELMLLTEYFPDPGLRIIKDYVVSSDKELNRIGTVSTYGIRRYIVWTCEHLACFSQYFDRCEEILFILAQHETEQYISNNSQGTWCGLFSIELSNTEVPYKERYEMLLDRAMNAVSDDAPLFEKAFEVVFRDVTSRLVPPSIIGNKITPARWKTRDTQELVEIKVYTLKMIIENKNNFSSDIIYSIGNALINSFRDFFQYDLVEEYKKVTDDIIEIQDQKNSLIIVLEEYLRFLKEDEELSEEKLLFMQQWIEELKQTDFDGKLYAFLTRDIYSYGYTDEDRENKEKMVFDLVCEFMDKPDKIEMMQKILKNDIFKEEPLFEFAEKLGLIDSDYEFLEFIKNMADVSRNNSFSRGYYCGLFKKNGNQLSDNALNVLEKIKTEETDFALWVYSSLDYNKDGFSRLLQLMLVNLRSKLWIDILSTDEKKKIIKVILSCDSANKYNIIFVIFLEWLKYESEIEDSVLYNLFLEVLKKCIDAKVELDYYLPESILVSLPISYQKKGIEILVPLFEFDNYFGKTNNAVIDYINKIKNPTNEAIIFKVLADRLLIAQRQVLTRAQTGIFDEYPLNLIKEWLDEDEVNRPVLMAYHLSMPSLVNPDFSDLTCYMLTKYEDNDKVYQKFWRGNTNLVTISPKNIVDNIDKWYELTEKYMDSTDRRIKQWAMDKRKEIDNICDEYNRSEETYKRNI